MLSNAQLVFVFRWKVAIDAVPDFVATGKHADALTHPHRTVSVKPDIAVVGKNSLFLLRMQR